MKGVYIFIAEGFEDVEALGTNDVLRRGGVDVKLVSITDELFSQSSRGITISTDACLEDLETSHEGTDEKDFMIFPGGMPGTKNLAACKPLMELMQAHYDAGGSVAAICAAPGLVLSQLRGIEGAEFTCFEGFQSYTEAKGAKFIAKPSVKSGRIITGRSAGHALAFGEEILRVIAPEKVRDVDYGMFLDTE